MSELKKIIDDDGNFHAEDEELDLSDTIAEGWIALALTSFATWRPLRVLLGAWLFGGVTMLQFWLQSRGVQVPSQMLTMLPYVTIIVVLALISRNPAWIRLNKPSALGKPFYPQS